MTEVKNIIDIREPKMLQIINNCNKNFGSRRIYLNKVENGIAYMSLGTPCEIGLKLGVSGRRIQIAYGNSIATCNISSYAELENFISMVLLPYYRYGDQLYLDIIELGNGCKRVAECSGLQAVLFTHSIILGVKLNMIELTNAKLSKDDKIVLVDNTNIYSNNQMRVDNSW